MRIAIVPKLVSIISVLDSMIKLKYKSWEDVTIPIYQELIDIAKESNDGDDAFSNREIDILAVLCDSDRESLGNLRLDDYARLAQEAHFMHKMPFYTPTPTIELGNTLFNVVVDVGKFTMAQYVDYNTLRADVSTNIAQLVACLLVPADAKCYADGYDVGDVVKAINAELPYYKAFGMLHFFQLAQSAYLANTLRLESKKMKQMARHLRGAERAQMLKVSNNLRKAYISLGQCWLSK